VSTRFAEHHKHDIKEKLDKLEKKLHKLEKKLHSTEKQKSQHEHKIFFRATQNFFTF